MLCVAAAGAVRAAPRSVARVALRAASAAVAPAPASRRALATYYSKDHEYARLDGKVATVGITEFAAAQLGDVVYVTLPAVGDSFKKGCVPRLPPRLVWPAHPQVGLYLWCWRLVQAGARRTRRADGRPLLESRRASHRRPRAHRRHRHRRESFASVESVKAASDVYAPLSGKVIETNTKLADDPALVNSGAEAAGWFVKLEVAGGDATAAEAAALMGDAAYKAHCAAAAAEKH